MISAELPTSASQFPSAQYRSNSIHRMRGTVLVLALLTLLIVAHEGKCEGNTVRLCGRDFVRAIVFTCGGSRWKRHLTDYHYLFASNFYVTDSENILPFSEENNSFADYLMYTDQRPETDSKEIHNIKPEAGQDLQNTRKMSVLKKREAAKLLTTSCCSIGCNERDISSLC
ncbi:insulin-like peptide INSL5 [Phaenicophaeus curvirostris]|uniref:insulin-like peptide INSL5 n=1 Tax=Phaenicophaeus curvirostris TaxID=33595 RepID=UPI0037F0E4A7